MLSWHYRSKHQSLIAVSNKEFYENKLFIVPSPYDAVAGMGLKFNLMKDTAYDRGGTRTNPKEAKAVAEAVIRHAREHPEQTLGVATFSVAQRQAVLKELELLRRGNPDVEEFFSGASHEPFFVKNLENIQGDERDVIFISVGYGKTETGYLNSRNKPHDRQIVLLPPGAGVHWLDLSAAEDLMLQPAPAGSLTVQKIWPETP
jgi:superfamily I DNA and/or RNA helicase